jgi:hypothetical protein
MLSGPTHMLVFTKSQKQIQIFSKERIIVVKRMTKKRKGLYSSGTPEPDQRH